MDNQNDNKERAKWPQTEETIILGLKSNKSVEKRLFTL